MLHISQKKTWNLKILPWELNKFYCRQCRHTTSCKSNWLNVTHLSNTAKRPFKFFYYPRSHFAVLFEITKSLRRVGNFYKFYDFCVLKIKCLINLKKRRGTIKYKIGIFNILPLFFYTHCYGYYCWNLPWNSLEQISPRTDSQLLTNSWKNGKMVRKEEKRVFN